MKVKLKIHDIAVKQLESAVWMYAYDYDEVAVHTIAGAAFELYTTRLKIINFDEDFRQILKKEKFIEFKSIWNKPFNIFKHGEYKHKPVEEYIYDEDTTAWLIFIACEANLLGPNEYRLNCAKTYKNHFILNNPDLVEKKYYDEVYMEAAKSANLTIEYLKSKEALRAMLGLIGNTFTNGTKSPYRNISSD